MMRTLRKRVLVTLATGVMVAAAGAAGGYLLARAITVAVTGNRLDQYAGRVIADGESSSAELRTVLAAVDASRYRPCSTIELGYFRKLIFESEFLKDAGRIRNGEVQCSAAWDHPAHARSEEHTSEL